MSTKSLNGNIINFFELINNNWVPQNNTINVTSVNNYNSDAGKFIVMDPLCRYLITNINNTTLSLYINDTNTDNSFNTD